jgi:hypothetical protein
MAITNTTIDLAWLAGFHPFLTLMYSVYNADTDAFIADAGTNLEYTVTGLDPGTYYSFYIKSRVEYPPVLGDEILLNSQFTLDENWNKGPGWNILNGIANNDGQVGDLTQPTVPFVIGNVYRVSFQTQNAAYNGLGLRYSVGGATFQGATSGDGVHNFDQTAEGDNTDVRLMVNNANDFLGSVEYFSLKELVRGEETVYSLPSIIASCRTVGDPDAENIIDAMPELPTQQEQAAINTFIIAEKAANNWGLYDDILCFKLTSEANALHGWITDTDASNVGGFATKVADGFSFNGATSYIQTIPSIEAGPNFIVDDAHMEAYIETIVPAFDFTIFGVFVPGETVTALEQSSNSTIIAVNRALVPPPFPLMTVGLSEIERFDVSNEYYIIDGVSASRISSSPTLSIGEPAIGARVVSGVDSDHFEGTISFYSVGASLPDKAAHYTNVQNLMDSL